MGSASRRLTILATVLWATISAVATLSAARCLAADPTAPADDPFAKENLVAWCIVPFDAAKRGPAERAEMVRRLGLSRVAYDWRAEQVAEFEEEVRQYKRQGIEFFAFWSWHDDFAPLVEKYDIHPQFWLTNPSPPGDTQAVRVEAAANQLLPIVRRAGDLGCKVGLYNHGGWGGEPENLFAVAEELRTAHQAENVGIVYNFHHAHEHIADFESAFKLMQPYLLCVNLNGMTDADKVTGEAQKILPIGRGDHEAAMINVVRKSGYTGPIGILDHRSDTDAEQSLRENLEGLERLLSDDD